jgi:hypothetical protein
MPGRGTAANPKDEPQFLPFIKDLRYKGAAA